MTIKLYGTYGANNKGSVYIKPDSVGFYVTHYGEAKRVLYKQNPMTWKLRHGRDWTGVGYSMIESYNEATKCFYTSGNCMRSPSVGIQFWEYNELFAHMLIPEYSRGSKQYVLQTYSAIYSLDAKSTEAFKAFIEQSF